MIKRIDSVFLQVGDLDQAIKWYSDNLGLKLRWKNQYGYAAMEVGETVLTLVEGTDTTKQSHMQFNFYTSDIDKMHKELVSKGVKVGKLNGDSNFAYFQFEDLCENILGFCWFPEDKE